MDGSVLETTRLRLRPWSEGDDALLNRLSSDPRVVRYILDGAPWTREKAAAVSRLVTEHWRSHGFGWRVAIERGASTPTGFIALNYAGDGTVGVKPGEFEIGWWLEPTAWGRGLASEGARAICEEAFVRVGAPSVIARLQPSNAASAAVAQTLGMRLELETTGRVAERVHVYRVAHADWLRLDRNAAG